MLGSVRRIGRSKVLRKLYTKSEPDGAALATVTQARSASPELLSRSEQFLAHPINYESPVGADLGSDLLPLALDRTENPARPKANWLRVLTGWR